MASIIFVQPDGTRATLAVPDGQNLMAAATGAGLDHIVGECGGNAMCATCHVFVEADQIRLLPAITEDEDALLDGTAVERQPNSRLACQITASAALDGLIVRLPEKQI